MKLKKKMKTDMNKLHIRLRNILLTVLGTLLLSFATSVFILPYNLVVGGISGLAIILSAIIPLAKEVLIAIVTVLLFVIGVLALSRGFAIKTLVSTIVYPIGVSLFSYIASTDVLGGFFHMPTSANGEIGVLLAAIFGGVFTGAGCALAFLGGGSTGGVDIIALVLCKFFKSLKSSVMIFVIDSSIIVIGMFINGDFVLTLLGIVCAFLTAIMIDKVFLGRSRAFVANIISERHVEINRAIIERIDRTTTIIRGNGGYTGREYSVLTVSFTMNQYADLLRIVNEIDERAFITIYSAHEINGEGFSRDLPNSDNF